MDFKGDPLFKTPEFFEFSKAIFAGAAASGEKLTAERVRAIYKLVYKYPLPALLAAIENHYTTSEFPIKPANIINFIQSRIENKDIQISGIFRKVVKKIQANSYDDINFNCPKIHYAISIIGGMSRICNCLVDELIWLEKEFVKAYREAEARGISWENAPVYISSPYKNCYSKKIIVNLNSPGRKSLPGDLKPCPFYEPKNLPEQVHEENLIKIRQLISGVGRSI